MITIVAQSKEKESVNYPGYFWWIDYAVKEVNDSFILQQRYLCYYEYSDNIYAWIDGKPQTVSNLDDLWKDWGELTFSFDAALDSCYDSSYARATSLDERHAKMVKFHEAAIVKRNLIYDLENKIQDTQKEYTNWKFTEQMKFNKKVKNKTAEYIEQYKKKTLLRLKPTQENFLAQIKETQSKLEEVKKS